MAHSVGTSLNVVALQADCHDLVPGDACDVELQWALHTGLTTHPEWYPGLTAASAVLDWQSLLHKTKPQCAVPCGAKSSPNFGLSITLNDHGNPAVSSSLSLQPTSLALLTLFPLVFSHKTCLLGLTTTFILPTFSCTSSPLVITINLANTTQNFQVSASASSTVTCPVSYYPTTLPLNTAKAWRAPLCDSSAPTQPLSPTTTYPTIASQPTQHPTTVPSAQPTAPTTASAGSVSVYGMNANYGDFFTNYGYGPPDPHLQGAVRDGLKLMRNFIGVGDFRLIKAGQGQGWKPQGYQFYTVVRLDSAMSPAAAALEATEIVQLAKDTSNTIKWLQVNPCDNLDTAPAYPYSLNPSEHEMCSKTGAATLAPDVFARRVAAVYNAVGMGDGPLIVVPWMGVVHTVACFQTFHLTLKQELGGKKINLGYESTLYSFFWANTPSSDAVSPDNPLYSTEFNSTAYSFTHYQRLLDEMVRTTGGGDFITPYFVASEIAWASTCVNGATWGYQVQKATPSWQCTFFETLLTAPRPVNKWFAAFWWEFGGACNNNGLAIYNDDGTPKCDPATHTAVWTLIN